MVRDRVPEHVGEGARLARDDVYPPEPNDLSEEPSPKERECVRRRKGEASTGRPSDRPGPLKTAAGPSARESRCSRESVSAKPGVVATTARADCTRAQSWTRRVGERPAAAGSAGSGEVIDLPDAKVAREPVVKALNPGQGKRLRFVSPPDIERNPDC